MHPNVVNVYDVGQDRGVYYMVMELVEGITLKEYIEKKGRLSAKAVSYTHLPASPGIGKINDVYRKVIYIKDENYDTLVRIKNGLEQYIEVNPGYRKMRIQFDFNPMHVF